MEERRKILHPWSKNMLLYKRNHNKKKSCVGILKYNRDDKITVFDNKHEFEKFCKNWENGNEKVKEEKWRQERTWEFCPGSLIYEWQKLSKRKKNTRRILKEIIFKNIFQNWRQEFSDWKRSITVDKKQLTTRHTIKKSESTRDKEKILWSSREKT